MRSTVQEGTPFLARDRNCNTCGRKGHFAKYCRSTASTQTNIVEKNQAPPEHENHRANPQDNHKFEVNLESFLVLAVDMENQVNAEEVKIEGGVRTLFNHDRLELKKNTDGLSGGF